MTTESGKSLAMNLKSSTDHRTRDMDRYRYLIFSPDWIGIGIGTVLNGSGCLVMLVTSGCASVWSCLVLHQILSGWLCLLSEYAVVCCRYLLLSV
ncbi:hypothetical protein Tco_1212881 [Tanacetum coccineum]